MTLWFVDKETEKRTKVKARTIAQNITDLIKELESRKEIFVIRPSESLKISRLEKNPSVLEKTYKIGYADASKNIKKLKEYLKK